MPHGGNRDKFEPPVSAVVPIIQSGPELPSNCATTLNFVGETEFRWMNMQAKNADNGFKAGLRMRLELRIQEKGLNTNLQKEVGFHAPCSARLNPELGIHPELS